MERNFLPMDNNIFLRQNDRKILLMQNAQREEYTKAKRDLYIGFYLSIAGTFIFIVLTSLFELELITTLSSFTAIAVFSLKSYLEKTSYEHIDLGAKIQQTIDTHLFQMPDKCHTLLPSEIDEITAPYAANDLSKFKNWYSDYSTFDFTKQIFFSQKENIRWDKKLREKFSKIIISLMIILPVLLIIYLMSINTTISHSFALASWLFPLEQFLITQQIGLRKDILYLVKINNEYKDIEKSYDKNRTNEILCKLCGLQAYIYEHRKKSVLIPNWFYKKNHRIMQEYENVLAEESNENI